MATTECLKDYDDSLPVLRQIVDLIVETVSPDKVILFGSYARGDFTQKSDVDIIVLKRNLQRGLDVIDLLYDVLFEKKIKIAVDFISIDYDKYYELCHVLGYIYKTINKEGKVLYAKL